MIDETLEIDPAWDQAVHRILIWLRLNNKEALTPLRGKAICIQPRGRRNLRSRFLYWHRVKMQQRELTGDYS